MSHLRNVTIVLVLLLIWFALARGINLYVDLLWFESVGYREVFQTRLWAKSFFWLIGFGATLALVGANFRLASRRSLQSSWLREDLTILARSSANSLFWVLILAVSTFVGIVVQAQWMSFLQYQQRVTGGLEDPIFQQDLSFYFFSLPVLSFGVNLALALLSLSFVIAAASYVIHGHLGYLARLRITPAARTHLLALMATAFLLVAYRFWLQRYDLLYSERGVTFGAGYTDLHAQLYSYYLLFGLACLTALLLLVSTLRRTLGLAIASAAFFALAYLVLDNVYPWAVQRFVVEPNEFQKESSFIAHNIEFTLRAYKLHDIEAREFAAAERLSEESLFRNRNTLNNIRLWDWRPVTDCYDQLQSIRPYYEFQDVDVDRYVLDNNYRQVLLSVRELDFSRISRQAQRWQNQFLQYTHGYGLCLSPVNEVTSEGLPEFFIKDIPPRSSVDLQVTRPEIYFGEKTDSPVFVKTTMEEFDYPIGDQNAVTTYQADRGLSVGSFFRKLLVAWKLKSYQVLVTENFTEDTRVLLHRRIQERVPRIAPFLRFDNDPYIVIHGGRLFWLLDAYTVSDRYPYSKPHPAGFNYIRNSVKVVVDAYLGDVNFYIVDTEDPLIQVYARIFPTLFKPLEAMPKGLREHIRYPEDFFHIQRDMFRTYHMRDPRVFYNKEDLWEIPHEIYAGEEQVMESYYVIMSLPGNDQEEFILLTPFTPRNKNNMISWLAARSDGEHYGKLILFQFPKQKLTYGPMQVEARIDQDPDISQLITLWSQKGSQVNRGNLLVIPIEESILYVEPLYLQAEKSEIPALTRIIVVYGNRVAMAETLSDALQAALGSTRPLTSVLTDKGAPALPAEVSGASEELTAKALGHFQRSQRFLREGRWAAYGEEQRELEKVLQELVRLRKRNPATGTAPVQERE